MEPPSSEACGFDITSAYGESQSFDFSHCPSCNSSTTSGRRQVPGRRVTGDGRVDGLTPSRVQVRHHEVLHPLHHRGDVSPPPEKAVAIVRGTSYTTSRSIPSA
uniref:Uncharacterized protein n=1 Tax=Rhodosorus marinus TaxID=101924 RepID=A0A7S3A604_9RHOD